MGNMLVISQDELQHVSSRRKNDLDLRLPISKVEVLRIVRDRPIPSGQFGVDQEMVMAGSSLLNASRSHSHSAKTDAYLESCRHCHSVPGRVKVEDHSLRSSRTLPGILTAGRKGKSRDADERDDQAREKPADPPPMVAALLFVPHRDRL
jgi:hypothetical protein